MFLVTITPHLAGARQVVPPYKYDVDACKAHTAVHRAMMRFRDGPGRSIGCDSFSVTVCRHQTT